jgi:putative SOS response-associated peptidase YedK
MCGRFTLTEPDFDTLCELLGAVPDSGLGAQYRPRYNIAPTDTHVIVADAAGQRRLAGARWGLGAEKPQINARAETVAVRPTFRDAFATGRCVVPADGFFEWAGRDRERRPFWIRSPQGGLLLFAGICERTPTGVRFAIITTPANAAIARLHDRMPALLAPDAVDKWLRSSPAQAERLLAPAPETALAMTEVSTRVNSVAHDDPECLQPPAPTTPRQLKLLE